MLPSPASLFHRRSAARNFRLRAVKAHPEQLRMSLAMKQAREIQNHHHRREVQPLSRNFQLRKQCLISPDTCSVPLRAKGMSM